MAESDNAIISIAVDAFVFNPAVCDGPNSRIAPITQPNYNYMSLQQEKVRADVLPQHELQYSLPRDINPRLVDIGSCTIRENRLGVYLHWVLPSVYRTGDTSASGNVRTRQDASATPTFSSVPNRWLVIRRIKSSTMVPGDAPIPEVEGWIVESDRLRDVSELSDDLDTQIDVSPYVSAEEVDKPPRHGRDFIGYKTSALGWTESNAPRVDLTVMSSSNQLFADYQPHNGNVFSICDNFSYNVDGKTQYLDSCDASYLVFGWHSDKANDILSGPIPANTTLREVLKKKHIRLVGQDRAVNDTSDELATLLWGAIHNVKWSVHDKPSTPAEQAAALFQDPTNAPISVGTGPLDALFTFIQSQDDQTELEKLILKIQTLLISQDDGVDDQDEAEDVVRNSDHDRFEGGVSWHISGTDGMGNDDGSVDVIPSKDALDVLREANATQQKLDSLLRTLPALQWELFSYWWKFLCDRGQGRNLDTVKSEVNQLSSRLAKLLADTGSQSVYTELPMLVQNTIERVQLSCEPAAADRFYQYQDPTLLIAGLESGWPKDHTQETKAQLNVHLVPVSTSRTGSGDPSEAQKLIEELLAVMPAKLQPEKVAEIANAFLDVGDTGENPDNQTEWTRQPWSPLFLEWELEYYHIPYEHWSMDRHQVNSSGTMEHIRWGIKPDVDVSNIPGVLGNMRKIDGRVLLLPQPGFSLSSKVDQLFTNVPDDILDKYISKADREKLVSLLAESFPYMTSPLSGFTNHLLTVQQGTHINPNQRFPGSDIPEPTQGAIELTESKIGLGEVQLRQVGDETAKTPYAIQVSGLPKEYAAFKPATHGQFRFTKLNIIDKFGQAISVIDQSPAVSPPPVYPCISDIYTVQLFGEDKVPNTVIRDPDGKNEFIQIPPRINQPMRLNTHFLIEEGGLWRPVDDWENPIFGWLLINFANYGLQVYLPDGRFYREIRLGGASGATVSEPWLPFSPPDPPPQVNPELDLFLAAMQDNRAYLEGVYNLILAAFKNMQDATDSYAEFLSALLGKPVALTNIGFSLELSTAENQDQTVYSPGVNVTHEKSVLEYELPLRIGDKNRAYDGLVGYYEPGHPEKIYTHYSNGSPTEPIDITTYPQIKPFFINPGDGSGPSYVSNKNTKLLRMVALLDPFVAVHGFTGLSPITEIKLPNWTVESALKKMTAFFHLGPVMATKDVPAYDGRYKLTADYGGDVDAYPGNGFAIPAGLKKEDWIWLQPYGTGDDQDGLEFMALNVEDAEERVRWEPVPYTAVEGYLQLRRAVGGKPPSQG